MVSPSSALSAHRRALDERDRAVWGKRFDSKQVRPATADLDIEYNELILSWKAFQDNLAAPHDQTDFFPHPQNPRDVIARVRSIQSAWIASPHKHFFSTAMKLCDRFLATMDSHSALITILPDHECYASLFYGVLQSVFKASANYPRVIDGLLKALVKVNESICLPGKNPSDAVENMTSRVVRFYSLVFFLLAEFMDWYVRRAKCRLLKSPNHEPYAHLENLVCTVRSRGLDIMREFTDGLNLEDRGCAKKRRTMQANASYLWEEARIRQVGLQGKDRHVAAQNTIIRHLIWDLQDDDAQRSRMREDREFLLCKWLGTANGQLHAVGEQKSGIACLTTTPSQDLATSRFDWSYGSRRKYTRVEFQYASAHLQNHFDNDDQIVHFEPDVEVVTEANVLSSLNQWGTGSNSQVLAVGGSPTTAFPSPVVLISACYAFYAREAKLPVISHFCTLPLETRENVTLFEQGLLALAYSLIRQLVDCLPPVVDSNVACHLNCERFRFLNDTLGCWKEVLSLIDCLLSLAPPLLVCVIDGLDVLQDDSTDVYIRSLVRVLLTHTRHETTEMPGGKHGQRVLLKVLFTVTGRPSSLVETLSENLHILTESNRVDPTLLADDPALISDPSVVMNA